MRNTYYLLRRPGAPAAPGARAVKCQESLIGSDDRSPLRYHAICDAYWETTTILRAPMLVWKSALAIEKAESWGTAPARSPPDGRMESALAMTQPDTECRLNRPAVACQPTSDAFESGDPAAWRAAAKARSTASDCPAESGGRGCAPSGGGTG